MDRIDQNAGLENGPETTRPLQTTSANNEGNQTMLRDSESSSRLLAAQGSGAVSDFVGLRGSNGTKILLFC